MLPSTDLKAGYHAHKAEIDAAVSRVLESGWYILGEEVAAFERAFASYVGVKHAVGTGSGTDAICLALRAAGIGPGDAVITVSHTAVATVAAVELTGAAPILVDVDPVSCTLDPALLEDTIRLYSGETRLRCIVPVHLYGCPAALPEILEIAGNHGLLVLEDCAQAHGASVRGRRAGAWGDLAAFSFYPTKNLGALGDGGAVVTDDDRLAERLRALREYGWRRRYISELPGDNTRLDAIQAAILGVKLRYLDGENALRRELADVYDEALAGSDLVLPCRPVDGEHVFHQYVVRHPLRDELQGFLKSRGIQTQIHYPLPVHCQPAYSGRVTAGARGLRRSEEICRSVLSLPMYPQLTGARARAAAQAILEWQHDRVGR